MAERPLKVAFASHVSTLRSGAERSLLDVVIALARDGRVEPVVTVPAEGEVADVLRAESIPVFALPTAWWAYPAGGARARANRGAAGGAAAGEATAHGSPAKWGAGAPHTSGRAGAGGRSWSRPVCRPGGGGFARPVPMSS